MKISFTIEYHTKWGQQIAVIGSHAQLGNDNTKNALQLDYLGNGKWGKTIEINGTEELDYQYILINDASEILDEESGEKRKISLPKNGKEHWILKDMWRAKNHRDNPLYTTAFLEVIFKSGNFKTKKIKRSKEKKLVTFRLNMPKVNEEQQLCVVGNLPQLGNWFLTKPLLLGNENHPNWTGSIELKFPQFAEYKYGIYNTTKGKIEYLEEGENRRIDVGYFENLNQVIINDEYFRDRKLNWKGAGVALPVFSLRSETGFGVGEFTDLPKFVDWSKQLGMKMVQILPINDTIATNTWVDSYPYAAISVFALHPLYLNIEQIKGFKKAVNQKEYDKERKRLNVLSEVDYEAVLSGKLKYARQVFEKEKTSFLKRKDFKQFLKESEHWLKSYALFCFFRDKNNTVNFNNWKSGKKFSKATLTKFTSSKSVNFEEIAFYYFLQFYLDKQLKEATEYARSQHIILKGDIPIGIYRYSVDAWVAPELYNMNGQAGAPPDPFSETGQNWGFPTYNWEVMAQNSYKWWQNRLQQLSRYFDAFRIDHILGFFRIWEVPLEQVEGSFGVFNKAIPIRLNEFGAHGIQFNYSRFCEPHIPKHLIQNKFGDDLDFVINIFLEAKKDGNFQFKTEFDTQRKVEHWVNQKVNAEKTHLKKPLFDLLSNVLFFERSENGAKVYHPRIDFLKLPTFQELDTDTRNKLSGLYNDYFYHRQEEYWKEQAMAKLPSIRKATNMLICGEDLGMVPACVPGMMRDMEMLTLEIQRMSKNPNTEFLQAEDIPYWSVCSPSTHDMSPIRLWWEECDDAQKARFYYQELKQNGIPPAELTPYLAKMILKQHLNFPSMWTVFPIQDIVAMSASLRGNNPLDERINVPANPQHYWRYRFHLSVEELMEAEELTKEFGDLMHSAGRF